MIVVTSTSGSHSGSASSTLSCCTEARNRRTISTLSATSLTTLTATFDLHAEVEGGRGVGQGPDRHEVDAGRGDLGSVVESDAAGGFQCRRPPVAGRGVARFDGRAQLIRGHVVEQQAMGTRRERLTHLVDIAALDLLLPVGCGVSRSANGLSDPACDRGVVLLDQDRVVEAHAVVATAASGDGGLLQRAQAWGRLAGIEN